MAASPPHTSATSSNSYDLEITLVSAKHLKNVNWRSGDLKPYAVAYLHPDRRSATKPDDSGSTRPVWNERLSLPLPAPFSPQNPHLLLTLDVFHSKPSETPKPLVGSARIPLKDLIDPVSSTTSSSKIKTIELNRPSGRPQGKIKIKICVIEKRAPAHPGFQFPPPPPPSNYAYHFSPPPPQHIMPYSHPIPSPYSGYPNPYPGNYYSSPPPPYYSALPHVEVPPSPSTTSYYGGPSAPVDFTAGNLSYDQRNKSGRFGVGTISRSLGAMTLDQGVKYQEENIAQSHIGARDRADY